MRFCYNWESLGMIVNVMLPELCFITCTTCFCDMLASGIPLMEVSSSPDCKRPSSAAILFAAMLRTNTGLWPREELTPPTMLKPRLSLLSRWRVMVYSDGLEETKGRNDNSYSPSMLLSSLSSQWPLASRTCYVHPTFDDHCWLLHISWSNSPSQETVPRTPSTPPPEWAPIELKMIP